MYIRNIINYKRRNKRSNINSKSNFNWKWHNINLQPPNLTWDNVNTRLGIGKTRSVTLDISGHVNAVGNIYTQGIQPFNNGTDKAINIRCRIAGTVNIYSETTTKKSEH